MEGSDLSFLPKNFEIGDALDVISHLEQNIGLDREGPLVKWKSYFHQVLVESDSYFYKIYEAKKVETGPFQSLVRHALCEVYQDLGLDWSIVSVEHDDKIIDFEQRQKLHVIEPSEISFSELLLSFSHILDKVEELLEFNKILKQIQRHPDFSEVAQIKILRNCVNKHEDYAWFKDDVVLLDDADFYVSLANKDGEMVRIENEVSVPIEISYGSFLFTKAERMQRDDGVWHPHSSKVTQLLNCWSLFVPPLIAREDDDHLKNANFLPERLTIKGREDDDFVENKEKLIKCAIEMNEKADCLKNDVKHERAQLREGVAAMLDVPENLTEEDLLYHNNYGRRSFQWELWECCNNLCKFCYLGKDNRHTDKKRQLKSLEDLKKNLDNLDFNVYNNISLIGGEFFQGQMADPEIKESYMEMIHKVADLYADKKIGSVWITATLTIGDQADLYETLDVFERAGCMPLPEFGASGVWICTSWDAEGRFHTEQSRENWEFHMKNIENYYPWVKKNTTIILSQKLCEMYLNNEFSPHDFMDKFGTALFYKQPGIFEVESKGNGSSGDLLELAEVGQADVYLTETKKKVEDYLGFRFYPDRRTFRRFLIKYAKEDPDTYERLFNIMFRADELHRNFNNVYEEDWHARNKNSNLESNADSDAIFNKHCRLEPMEAKHIINYATYVDCNDCMICDRNQIWDAVQSGRI